MPWGFRVKAFNMDRFVFNMNGELICEYAEAAPPVGIEFPNCVTFTRKDLEEGFKVEFGLWLKNARPAYTGPLGVSRRRFSLHGILYLLSGANAQALHVICSNAMRSKRHSTARFALALPTSFGC